MSATLTSSQMMSAMMMLLLVHGPHSTQQGPPDPRLQFHCGLAMAVLSDSIYCDILSPGNNLTNSSKTMVLSWEQLYCSPTPPNKGHWANVWRRVGLSQDAESYWNLRVNPRGAAKHSAIHVTVPEQIIIYS